MLVLATAGEVGWEDVKFCFLINFESVDIDKVGWEERTVWPIVPGTKSQRWLGRKLLPEMNWLASGPHQRSPWIPVFRRVICIFNLCLLRILGQNQCKNHWVRGPASSTAHKSVATQTVAEAEELKGLSSLRDCQHLQQHCQRCLLKMHPCYPASTLDLLNRNFWERSWEICILNTLWRWFLNTWSFENHCFSLCLYL